MVLHHLMRFRQRPGTGAGDLMSLVENEMLPHFLWHSGSISYTISMLYHFICFPVEQVEQWEVAPAAHASVGKGHLCLCSYFISSCFLGYPIYFGGATWDQMQPVKQPLRSCRSTFQAFSIYLVLAGSVVFFRDTLKIIGVWKLGLPWYSPLHSMAISPGWWISGFRGTLFWGKPIETCWEIAGLEDFLGVASAGVFASVALPTPEGGMSESLD